jgi:hypothetical protein
VYPGFGVAGIDDRFLRSKGVSALIEKLPYGKIKEVDAFGVCLPAGQTIRGDTHGCAPFFCLF